MGNWRIAALALALGLVLTAGAGVIPAKAANTYTIMTGGESADMGAQVNVFGPASVTVALGDTVTWKLGSTEFHTVTFLSDTPRPDFVEVSSAGPAFSAAAVLPAGDPKYDGTGVRNSGLLAKGTLEEYSLQFTRPGTFEYVCLIHADMKGTIVVKILGSKADDPAEVQAAAAPQITDSLANRALPLAFQYANEKVSGDIGTGVTAGAGDKTVAIMRFLPGDLVVRNGDTVTWTNQDPETPHEVSFRLGAPAPDMVIPKEQTSGPPIFLLNPLVLMPGGGNTFDGTTPVNSGLFGGGNPGPNNFSLKFTKVGIYQYQCALHEEMGMKGTIVVLPRS